MQLKQFALILCRKMLFVAVAWIAVYLFSQPFRAEGILMLFAPLIGAVAGLVAGWYMATDAVENAGFHGFVLWVILIVAAVGPMWIMEGVLGSITDKSMAFGGFMLLTAANLLALASAVWHCSSQE